MGVDGFRFDLASLFTRNEDGTINLEDPPVIAEICAIPELAQLRLIAEAWDLASYKLGRSFPEASWLQWNGEFRDIIRRFLKGDAGMVWYGVSGPPDTGADSHAFAYCLHGAL